ncbi:hypothetical protein EHM69_06725 [candidate division KSB1 bacterium]|nr:MAG: hypothetical protein EHM69_06725 [candidate division KSB1 bacterium]
MKPKILWIEDEATGDMSSFAGPVYASMKYEFVIAGNASEGIRRIIEAESSPFLAVIVDIRLQPGDTEEWIDYFGQRGKDPKAARLGRELLYWLFKHEQANVKLMDKRPQWIVNQQHRFGILSVETKEELKKDLDELGITEHVTKKEDTPHTVLLDMIKKLVPKISNPARESEA